MDKRRHYIIHPNTFQNIFDTVSNIYYPWNVYVLHFFSNSKGLFFNVINVHSLNDPTRNSAKYLLLFIKLFKMKCIINN